MKTFTVPAFLAILSAFRTLPALADVAPPEGYVEACTVEKKVTASTECLACAAYHGAKTRCQTMLEPFCYSKVCQTYGASVWGEVFCRTKNASAPVVPQTITDVLSSSMAAVPTVAAPGACPLPGTDTDTGTETGTSTGIGTGTVTTAVTATGSATVTDTGSATVTTTSPVAEKDESGCSLVTGNTLRTLGPWSIALVSVLLASLRRRRR